MLIVHFFNILETDVLWGEGQSVWGKRAMSMGSPTEPRGLFQYLKFKKKKKTHEKKPTHKYSEAVGVFYWGLGKGKKRQTPFRGEAGVWP